jgi:AcrR family transcriptional regulator
MNLHERGKIRRKQRILDAVVEIVDDEGIAGLTISRVSERAEVSVKTIYNLMGSLPDILDEMSGTLFSSLAEQLRASDHAQDPKKFFDELVDKSKLFLQGDEKRNRAALTAILHSNITSGRSYRNTPSASSQFKFIAKGIRLFQDQGYIRSTVHIELLAEQMLYAEAMLLELWATKLIDLERYQLTYKYHIWTLIRAWTNKSFVGYADKTILDLQQKLVLLDSDRQPPTMLREI